MPRNDLVPPFPSDPEPELYEVENDFSEYDDPEFVAWVDAGRPVEVPVLDSDALTF